ncbi:hypothetical protein CL6EHI_095310 [Entamoeba histolytica]|uniref:Uncharacterized protein n=4 Tax=Entamoeba histolytica TaxID=5759 RepID=C4M9P5_ENTH1|nr:hypothetical protein EHI_095310 [Entamoeba histolytica HM-1:IMSS]EAL43827.2 hypothetical protein EHI_095310 [Entamoeba histolytica HM-1:IMSS]EMD46147.1 Hypothetical protein EHI5A_188250 [Entamoeba histolytica KU27]EMD46148.1 Hypothetical protein EHI5A_188260 [Entamoeba histolytica KU27]GAT98410.1 hypothetical protein CL6EHI_095310 [Entamoeba histolytica]|eukprot:XP_649213.2 hypothetical protein EHI_095310 [Entamoeba histolytica HM-1:IMSS]
MDTEERMESTGIENIDIKSLKNYFIDLDTLEDICDDLVQCFKKEQLYYLEEDKFNSILDEEAALVNTIHEITSSMKKDYGDILQAFEIRATERARRRRVAISRELNKKPKMPKDN